jgi:hypothetical protein
MECFMPTRKWIEANREYLLEYNRNYNKKNKDRQKRYKQKVWQWFLDYKKTQKCENCPEAHPACLDFHHINPDEKKVAIGLCVHSSHWGIERIKLEIAKCKVLCSNCHRKLHWDEKRWRD